MSIGGFVGGGKTYRGSERVSLMRLDSDPELSDGVRSLLRSDFGGVGGSLTEVPDDSNPGCGESVIVNGSDTEAIAVDMLSVPIEESPCLGLLQSRDRNHLKSTSLFKDHESWTRRATRIE